RQLVADVSLGLFLSSGVDSSLLAALVNKHFAGGTDFNFFTVAFSEQTSSDESDDAFSFIQGFQNPRLISHQLTIDAELIGNRLDTMYEFVDEPFGDPATLLNWVIASKAKEHVTVVLSGDGADELFWGYNRYDQWKNPALTFSSFRIPGAPASIIKPFIPGGFYQTKAELELSTNPVERHFNLFLSPALEHLRQEPPWNLDSWAMHHIALVKEREDLPAIMDLKTYLADAMLYKVDRASMASSLEVRVPYLDNKVIDYALALPFSFKSNSQFRHKAILKQLLQHLAPHYDIRRPKKGFNFPLERWLRSAWKDKVLGMVDKNCLQSFGLDDKIYLPMIQNYYAGDKKPAIVLWYLLNLALWKQKFEKITPLSST
ncbi:MAG TPA: asparagine synthase C-terminal domain-containing protein, partial [Puia sp.]|nr:asparagine synthase C-terminal domain-containing protein [Puia sp.]